MPTSATLMEKFQLIRRFFTVYSRMPKERALRQEQASILFYTIFLFCMLGSGSATLFTFAFDGWRDPPISACYAILIGLYLVLLFGGFRWRRRPDEIAFIRNSVRVLCCIGVVWGILVNLFAGRATADQHGILIGLIMALVSAPMLGVPLSAALAFFVPITLCCSIAILFALQPIEYVAVLSFIGFLVFAFTGLVYMNKTIMDRLTDRLNLQREHEIVRVFLREYEEVSSDWLWETDEHGRLRNVGVRMADALRQPAAVLETIGLGALSIVEDGEDGAQALLLDAFRRRSAFRDLAIAVRIGESRAWLSLTGHPVYDETGVFRGFRGIGSDITQARAARRQIEFLASHDGLTRLLNRQSFVAAVETACAANHGPFALLLIDLDDFKAVNDDLGHLAGDQLLETVATRLCRHLRDGDQAARIGGDEFAIMRRCDDGADALRIAELLQREIQLDAAGGTPLLASGASIGIAVFPEHGETTEPLMKRADLALYTAKNRGKAVCCLFEQAMETDYLGRLRLLSELATALDQGQIFVEYQPIIDIATGQLVSTEALARWSHPVHGVLTAGSFIPSAESSDLIERLGERVLRLACLAAMGWDDEIPVAVNLSPKQLRSGRFVATLDACLAESGLPADRLTLEVTESVFLGSSARAIGQLDAIRARGVRIVLDDFGTGYSSLTYLRRFDVDGIKIDASFIRDLPGSRKVSAIVRTIGRLASDMNIYVTAEGVETPEQLRWLRNNGIAFAQGFLLGRSGVSPRIALMLARGAAPEGTLPADPSVSLAAQASP